MSYSSIFGDFRLPLKGLAVLLLASTVSAGDIVGRVTMIEKNGRQASDMSDVIVYVDQSKTEAKPGRAVIAMKGKAFSPHVLAVETGTTVDFPNMDPILHNVFSASGGGFDMGLYKRPETASRTFDKAGTYTLYCNIHPQMSALVVVRDNPYFAKASKDGTFRLTGVPPGNYKILAFHEHAGKGAPVVAQVRASGDVAVTLSLDASSYKRVRQRNKYGKPYGRSRY